MDYKVVFSQIPGCSYGNTPNNSLSCAICDMRLATTSQKLYVPVDQAIPTDTETVTDKAVPGENLEFKVNYSAPVKKDEIKIDVTETLEVVSATLSTPAAAGVMKARSVEITGEEGTQLTVVVKVKETSMPSQAIVSVDTLGVRRIFNAEVLPQPSETDKEMELESVTVEKKTIEVEEETKVSVNFKEKSAK